MKLVEALPDGTMFVSGYEHHTLECVVCGETERRLVFRHAGEPWEAAPAIGQSDACEQAPYAETPANHHALVPDEPQPAPLSPHAMVSEETPRTWQRDIANIRARLDDLRHRAELAKQEVRQAEQFNLFWDGLVPRDVSEHVKTPNAGPVAPLPKSRSLVVAPAARPPDQR